MAVGRGRRVLAVLALVAISSMLLMSPALAALEGLEEEQPVRTVQHTPTQGDAASQQKTVPRVRTATTTSRTGSNRGKKAFAISNYFGPIEGIAGIVLSLFCLNYVFGRRANAAIAVAWGRQFAAGDDSMLEKNFSLVDIPDGALVQDSANMFRVYATGRRHVTGMVVTLDLKARQDLLARLWYIIFPREDTVMYEAQMAEASCPPTVLAVGTNKAVRRLVSDQPDVARYTKKVPVTLADWPEQKLAVHAEHAPLFYDLFGEVKVLSTLGAESQALKWFRSVHVSDEYTEGTHKRVVRMTFALPPTKAMDQLAPLVALVPLFIDMVGTFKMPVEARKKAEAARAQAAEEEATDGRKARMEALAQRKAEKLAEEKARIARLPPAERQKAEDKLQKRLMEKQMRKRVKMG